MLTKSEREWLEHRDAMQFLTGTYIADFAEYQLWNSGKDWKEAAEFSESVAAKLAKVISNLVKEEPWPDIEVQATTPDLVLKWVRLSVEEEMNAEV